MGRFCGISGPDRRPAVCYPWGMAPGELAHLELLAQLDALLEGLKRWATAAPPWQPAQPCPS